MRGRFRSDRGASVFMLAISLFLLIGASAIAVDIAAIWLDRSTDQKVTDSAAAVGVLEADRNGGEAACQAALTYVATNTEDLAPSDVDLTGCVAFDVPCTDDPPTLPRQNVVTAGRYEITVVYPVNDTHDLMTSRIIGRQPQDVVEDDGDPCERVGVKMTSTRNSLFAQVLGFGPGETTVHTVARRIPGDQRAPFNLLVLDRTGCSAINVGGGGTLILDAVIARDDDGNPTGGLAPGLAAADSDGSECTASQGVITLDGSGSMMRADGPENCPTSSGTHQVVAPDAGPFTAYEGCGSIQVFAPGTPGCNPPACSGNDPAPPPTALGRRYTRQPADHAFNCYSDYTAPPDDPPDGVLWAVDPLTGQQSIEPCEEGTDPHIYDLIQFVGETGLPDADFEFWSDRHGCNIGAAGASFSGDVVVDCGTLQIGGPVVITDGRVVFDGNVTVTSDGSLTVTTPADNPWAFFRNGRLRKSGQAAVAFHDTMVYVSKTSDVRLSGGDGSLIWTSPKSGDFDGLALWSDSPAEHAWAGQANLTMEGVFFMPLATASYSGNGELNQTEAQWVAWRLEVSGNGALRLAPNVGKAIRPFEPRTILIR